MATEQAERPRFFQGQYLGPEDLSAAVDHAHWARARHDLGAHSWGIGVGLGLLELPALDGGTEAYVEPGYAVDGFGRTIVVAAAHAVPIDALQALSVAPAPGETSVRVPVWLRYAEERTQEPPPGFEVCETDDQRSRIAETFQVLVGARSHAEQRDPVEVAGEEIDAAGALRTADPDAPLLCDAAVPFQTFPDDQDRWWLIPLGYVRWEPGSPGRILPGTEADLRAARRLRRYLGVVAESLLAADGLIRLRRRTTEPPPGGVSTEAACDHPWPRAQSELDLLFDSDRRRVTPTELVWIEGDLRLAGDGRIFGGQLEWRDRHGDDHGVPMSLRRMEANAYVDSAGGALSGRDLQVLIGSTSDPDGRNRLVVGAAPAEESDVPERVIIQSDGRVGIGTADPSTFLRFPLTLRGIGGGEELLGFEAPDGTLRWHLNQNLHGSADGLNFVETGVSDGRLFLQAGGRVGINTTDPAVALHVRGGRIRLENAGRRIDLRADGSAVDLQSETHNLYLRSSGPGGNNNILMNPFPADGNVGIGTQTPNAKLEVWGNVRLGGTGELFAVGAPANLRAVAGRISEDGSSIGAGFSAIRVSTGRYRISFDTAFTTPPAVVASPLNVAAGNRLLTVRSLTTSSFVVDCRQGTPAAGGTLQDTAFTFIALGAQL